MVAEGEGLEGGMAWEAGVSRGKLSHAERLNNEALLYSTENYVQCPVINHNGEEYFFSSYSQPHLWHMEVPGPGEKVELQLRQLGILNPLSKASDQICILTETPLSHSGNAKKSIFEKVYIHV